MHVGLNLVFLVPGETGGMEVVARELVPALRAARPDVRFTAFVNREMSESRDALFGGEVRAIGVGVRARNRIEWVRGEQQILPRLAARAGVDVLHSLASTAPGWGRFARVTTVHDLIYRVMPEAHAGVLTLGMRVLVPLAVRRSHRVIADSRSTRDDLVRYLNAPAGKIDVVPLGLGAVARVVPTPEALLRERLELGARRVVLSVSAKRPHKNLMALLEALAAIPAERRPVTVLPGYPTWYEPQLRERARALAIDDDVRLLDWVSAEDLEGLYALAAVFVFPSLYEGFGLPVLEAMARGVPVACSNASSLPEVAGDAALLFDARSPRAIAAALERLLGDRAEAARLRAAGTERVRSFSWERSAQLTFSSYERALGA